VLKSDLSQYLIQPAKTVTEYSESLSTSFNLPPRLTQFSMNLLTTRKSYIAWKESKANCMLLLNGQTIADQTSCCWLSPAAIELAALLKQERIKDTNRSRVSVAELYCQKTDFMKVDVTRISAVICLVLQLLEANLSILGDTERYDRLRAQLVSIDGNGYTEFSRVCALLIEVLQYFDLVYFIIDRVDRIGGNFMRDFLNNLMLKKTTAKVRVLCVASRNQSETAKKIDELQDEMDESDFAVLCLDQERS